MQDKDYEKYYKKGGFYEIPIEIFNQILADLEEANNNASWWSNRFYAVSKESERLKEYMKSTYESSQELLSEKQNRINKAIEYIDENRYLSYDENCEVISGSDIDYLLEILKGENNE